MVTESIRPVSKVPVTSSAIDRSLLDAQVAHEQHIGYYLEHSELSIIDEEQQAIEALLAGLNEIGLSLPGTTKFFVKQRELSSGVRGVARIQGKEVVTAGNWPGMFLPPEKIGILDRLSGFIGRGKQQEGQTK